MLEIAVPQAGQNATWAEGSCVPQCEQNGTCIISTEDYLRLNEFTKHVYCVQCGAQNADDTAFCKDCGARLTPAQEIGRSAVLTQQKTPSEPIIPSQGKIPFIAALLNLFFGVGYLYLGYKRVMGVRTIVFVLLLLILYFIGFYLTYGIATLIAAIVMAIDGFQKADGEKGFISAE